MDQQQQGESKKGFFRNDRKLVCSMLVFYGLCILGLVAGTVWGLDRRSKAISANATSTDFAVGTRQAKVTATAVARASAQAQYSFIEPFDDNSRGWFAKTVDDEYMRGSIAIEGGTYVWDIREVKKPFSYWANFPLGNSFKDFDMYVDFKVADDAPDNVCGGFVFRSASTDWEKGAYIFSVCKSSYFYVSYYKQGKYEDITNWMRSRNVQTFGWNRLEMSARGSHFTFLINGNTEYEMNDDRQKTGGLALVIAVNTKEPVRVFFDNFGFQPR